MKNPMLAVLFIILLLLFLIQFSFACEFKECDTTNNKWCDQAGSWQASNYCTDTNIGCGYQDADCLSSIGSCTENKCDSSAKKYCSSNTWTSSEYCDINHCYNTDVSYCSSCSKTEDIEVTCNDDKDNDCDHYFDCNDNECTNKPGCECTLSQTQVCGTTDIGECTYSTQTCISGSWSECTAVFPSDELC